MSRLIGRMVAVQAAAAGERNIYNFAQAPSVAEDRFEKEWGVVLPEFISKAEERTIALYCHSLLSDKPYDTGHWDRVIRNFREAELDMSSLPDDVQPIVDRLKALFRDGHEAEPRVHTIDLAEDGGRIDGHIDSVKFCGDHIIGLSLLSASVLRMTRAGPADVHPGTEELAGFRRRQPAPEAVQAETTDQAPAGQASTPDLWESAEGTGRAGEFVDVLLPRRSAYIMHNVGRYGFEHAVLGQDGDGTASPPSPLQAHVHRRRRISVIVRDAPRDAFAVNVSDM
jgi:hypothetical protein